MNFNAIELLRELEYFSTTPDDGILIHEFEGRVELYISGNKMFINKTIVTISIYDRFIFLDGNCISFEDVISENSYNNYIEFDDLIISLDDLDIKLSKIKINNYPLDTTVVKNKKIKLSDGESVYVRLLNKKLDDYLNYIKQSNDNIKNNIYSYDNSVNLIIKNMLITDELNNLELNRDKYYKMISDINKSIDSLNDIKNNDIIHIKELIRKHNYNMGLGIRYIDCKLSIRSDKYKSYLTYNDTHPSPIYDVLALRDKIQLTTRTIHRYAHDVISHNEEIYKITLKMTLLKKLESDVISYVDNSIENFCDKNNKLVYDQLCLYNSDSDNNLSHINIITNKFLEDHLYDPDMQNEEFRRYVSRYISLIFKSQSKTI